MSDEPFKKDVLGWLGGIWVMVGCIAIIGAVLVAQVVRIDGRLRDIQHSVVTTTTTNSRTGPTVTSAATTATYTLTINTPTPRHGDNIIFTGTFPQAAFKQARQPQYPDNPVLILNCGNETQPVLQKQYAGAFTKTGRNPDGSINATSKPILLDEPGSNGITWPTGQGATCYAYTAYWTQDKAGNSIYNPVGTINFTVGA